MIEKTTEEQLRLARDECERLRTENTRLRSLIKSDEYAPNAQITPSDLSSDDKIALFRSLFKGREDIYALRWESNKGKSGYSPACGNEWDRILCRKPQIKCSECPNSKFLQITDQVIFDHLSGQKMIGAYPL